VAYRGAARGFLVRPGADPLLGDKRRRCHQSRVRRHHSSKWFVDFMVGLGAGKSDIAEHSIISNRASSS
jgi:hypothetical protein